MPHFMEVGMDSPPELIAIPAIELSKKNGKPDVSLGLLVCAQSTMNESLRTTIGSNAAYRAGWERAFGQPGSN